ncbi:hypothetical protein HMPREF3185_00878 [Porphyromonas somerae]|uniref:Uncharacterized protein n=1 Tax=Porphyromonas somerae TaxID=322095 RepID=A0A134B9H4_9PORP|nr:hypothetical protein HMPREF3184_00878 [Porphyromonadaceae bacterium KA00676]KXB76587.1 hypothetical protein HMPREF3185_00878 [Porphyromonas somerae]
MQYVGELASSFDGLEGTPAAGTTWRFCFSSLSPRMVLMLIFV